MCNTKIIALFFALLISSTIFGQTGDELSIDSLSVKIFNCFRLNEPGTLDEHFPTKEDIHLVYNKLEADLDEETKKQFAIESDSIAQKEKNSWIRKFNKFIESGPDNGIIWQQIEYIKSETEFNTIKMKGFLIGNISIVIKSENESYRIIYEAIKFNKGWVLSHELKLRKVDNTKE